MGDSAPSIVDKSVWSVPARPGWAAPASPSSQNIRRQDLPVQVKEMDRDVIFLHSIAPGNADKSYGIHVARLAGVPDAVLARAEAVLESLEAGHQLKPPMTARVRKLKPQVTPGPSLFGDPVSASG